LEAYCIRPGKDEQLQQGEGNIASKGHKGGAQEKTGGKNKLRGRARRDRSEKTGVNGGKGGTGSKRELGGGRYTGQKGFFVKERKKGRQHNQPEKGRD